MKKTLLLVIVVCLIVIIILINNTRSPQIPDPVDLTTLKQNLRQQVFIGRDQNYTRHFTSEEIPIDASCQYQWSSISGDKPNFPLNCWWKENGEWNTAEMHIELPKSSDVRTWEFDRTNLRLVPTAYQWRLVNSRVIAGILIFSCIAIFCFTIIIYPPLYRKFAQLQN